MAVRPGQTHRHTDRIIYVIQHFYSRRTNFIIIVIKWPIIRTSRLAIMYDVIWAQSLYWRHPAYFMIWPVPISAMPEGFSLVSLLVFTQIAPVTSYYIFKHKQHIILLKLSPVFFMAALQRSITSIRCGIVHTDNLIIGIHIDSVIIFSFLLSEDNELKWSSWVMKILPLTPFLVSSTS